MNKKIQLTIDGRQVEAEPGTTILQLARQRNIYVPTLCYNEVLRPLEGCRLCVVRVDNEPHLLASCSTEVRMGMVVMTDSEEIRQIRKLMLELLLKEHYGDCVPPCHLTCPAGIDIQGYLALISRGLYLEALQLIRERLPMPLSIGRVCPHPCEYKCNRNLVEEPININHLKRFVADYEMHSGKRNPPSLAALSGNRVAIIGGGPAGLSAAYYLRRLGHASTIFESMPELGGMLRYGIPEYRLPKKILDWEIEGIIELGIDVETGLRWGKDFDLDSLKRQGYSTFFIAIGAWATRKLGIEGEELDGVLSGVDFLVDAALGRPAKMGRKVAIVGGGNVAIDTARNCVRLGAEEVTILYRRSREEMPASPEEIQGAEEEGVRLHFLAAPVRLLDGNGRVEKLEYVKMKLGEPDEGGRRRPIPIKGSETVIPVDMVIPAIGQFSNLSPLESDRAVKGLPTTRRNTIAADRESMYTGMEGVFTGGDVYRGPETVVGALADGRKAALAIHLYLRERTIKGPPRPFNILKGDLESIEKEQFSMFAPSPRERMPELPVDERISNYAQIELGLSEENAAKEAQRCLSCGCLGVFDCKLRNLSFELGVATTTRLMAKIPFSEVRDRDSNRFIALDVNKCIRCKQCYESCTSYQCSDAVEFDETPSINDNCVFCGLCLDACPTGALEERISGKPGPFQYNQVESICPHCGCGCNLVLNMKADMLFTVSTRPTAPPSHGHTCRKGRFDSFDYLQSPDRLRAPMVRIEGNLVETDWDEALDCVANGLKRLQEEHGARALAAIGSPRSTNEANYLLQKIFRNNLGSNNLDFPDSEACLATMIGLSHTLGKGAMNNPLREIEEAEVIFALGGRSIEENNPIVSTALRRASRTFGRRLITVGENRVNLDEFAAPALTIRQANGLKFLQTILHLMIRMNLLDQAFVADHTEGLEELRRSTIQLDPGRMAEEIGLSVSMLEDLARTLSGAASLAIVYSEDFTFDAKGTDKVEAMADLALLTGRPGQPKSGIYPLYRHINTQGALDMGLVHDRYPGHVPVTELPGHPRFGETWGDKLPGTAGLCFREIVEGTRDRKVRGIYVMDEGPPSNGLGTEEIRDALSRAEFVVVQGMFLTGSAKLADVVLPSACFMEQDGTVTNTERRVQRLKATRSAPDGALSDWRILAEILGRLDHEAGYTDAESVYREIMTVVPFYEGLTYDRLEGGGIRWPGFSLPRFRIVPIRP